MSLLTPAQLKAAKAKLKSPLFPPNAIIDPHAERIALAFICRHYGSDDKPSGPDLVLDRTAAKFFQDYKRTVISTLHDELGIPERRLYIMEVTKAETAKLPKVAKEKAAEQAPKASERKTKSVTTPHGEFREGSVLHAIYRSFDLKGGATKEEILERLLKEFPEKADDNMMSTIQTQIHRMPKEKGFELGRDDKGRYGIHIKERSKVRVLSPEAQAALEARQAEKAKRDEAEAAEKAKAKAIRLAEQEKANAEKAALAARAAADKAADAAKAAEIKALAEAKAAKAKVAKK